MAASTPLTPKIKQPNNDKRADLTEAERRKIKSDARLKTILAKHAWGGLW